jgi:hypothetical protein
LEERIMPEGYKGFQKGKLNPSGKKQIIKLYEKTCRWCDKTFKIRWLSVYKSKTYCSKECQKASYRVNPMLCRTGKANPGWKGGISKHGGYIRINLGKHNGGRIFEHRIVMEKMLRRKLTKDEGVHHKNGVKTDNRRSNLALITFKTHWGNAICPHCRKEFFIK